MALRFPFAPVPYVLRAMQSDDHYKARLRDHVQLALTAWRGGQFVSRHDEAIATAADGIYFAASMAAAAQSLGEEYMELLPIRGGRPLRLWLTVIHVALRVLLPIALRTAWARWLTQRLDVQPATALRHINLVHLGLFFLFAAYPTLAHRASGVRYLSLGRPPPSAQPAAGSGASATTGMYAFLGLLIMVQETVLLVKWLRARREERARREVAANAARAPETAMASAAERQRRNAATSNPADGGPVPASLLAGEDDSDDGVDRGRCTLCLCDRRMPAATQCGHMFCWECVMRWFESSNQANPICPNCRQSCPPQSVVLLANYKINAGSPTTVRSPATTM